MLPYYLLIGVPILFSAFQNKHKPKELRNKLPIILFFAMLLILLSIRSMSCGTDLPVYYDLFKIHHLSLYKNISFWSLFDLTLTEPGYILLEKISFFVSGGEFQFLLVVCAVISLAPLLLLYLKESNHGLLTIALFIGVAPFSLLFSGLRQSIAMGIGALCYICVKNKKPILFLLGVFVAFLFHQSALVLLLMYPVYKMNIKKQSLLFFFPFLLIILLFNQQILNAVIGLLGRFGDVYSTTTSTGAYGFLLLLIVFTIFCFVIPDEHHLPVDSRGLRNFLLIMLIIQCFAPVHTIAMRFNYYYLIFIPILIPKIIDNCSANTKQIAKVSVYVMVSFFFAYFFINAYFGSNVLRIFPYSGYWEG